MLKQLKTTNFKEIRKYVHSGEMMNMVGGLFKRAGVRQLAQVLKGRKDQRYHPAAVIAAMSYLEYENTCGRVLDEEAAPTGNPSAPPADPDLEPMSAVLGCDNKGLRGGNNRVQVYLLLGKAGLEAPKQKGTADGALFQLMQLAKYQAQYRANLSGLRVKGVEVSRFVPFYKDSNSVPQIPMSNDSGTRVLGVTNPAFQRHRVIDLVLANANNQETWVEFKSIRRKLNGQPHEPDTHKFLAWTMAGKGTGGDKVTYHRQFSVDRMALAINKSWNYFFSESPNNMRDQVYEVVDYRWRFDAFKIKKANGQIKEENVELGSASERDTIRWYFDQPPKDGGFTKILQLLTTNNAAATSERVKLVAFIEMKDALKAVGSEVIEQATEALITDVE